MGSPSRATRRDARNAESRQRDGDRARHHEGERRVPIAGEIEEAQNFLRIVHAREDEPEAEQEAGGERDQVARHDICAPQLTTCRAKNTTAKPAAMKMSVATSERGDRRARPQTPCPLVQPEPRRAPKPAKNPPRTRVAPDAANVGAGVAKARRARTGVGDQPGEAPIAPARRSARGRRGRRRRARQRQGCGLRRGSKAPPRRR